MMQSRKPWTTRQEDSNWALHLIAKYVLNEFGGVQGKTMVWKTSGVSGQYYNKAQATDKALHFSLLALDGCFVLSYSCSCS